MSCGYSWSMWFKLNWERGINGISGGGGSAARGNRGTKNGLFSNILCLRSRAHVCVCWGEAGGGRRSISLSCVCRCVVGRGASAGGVMCIICCVCCLCKMVVPRDWCRCASTDILLGFLICVWYSVLGRAGRSLAWVRVFLINRAWIHMPFSVNCGEFVKASCLFFATRSILQDPNPVFYLLISIQNSKWSSEWVSTGYSVGGPGGWVFGNIRGE